MKGHAASIGRQHIQRAYERIKSYIRKTPIVALGPHPQLAEADVVLKLELLQHAGSFKARGAFNNLLSESVPPAGYRCIRWQSWCGHRVRRAAPGTGRRDLCPNDLLAGQNRSYPQIWRKSY